MVVLHYIPSIDVTSGGLGSYMQIMTPELGKLVDLHVATHHTECELPLGNCTLHYISGTGINVSGKVRNEVCELIKNVKPDIIHINCCWTPLCAYFTMWTKELCRNLCVKIPVVYAPHGMLEPWIISHNYWTRKLPATLLYQKKALTCADLIHSTADSEMSNLAALGWNKNIVVIPNSVDTKSIKIKTDWTKKKKILFLSRVHQKKGINFIIEAACQLKKELDGYTISIIGPGEERYCNYLKSLTEKYAVEDIVHIEGPVFGEDKFTLFRNSDLFLLPTHSENFGIVVAESLACGTPVITTKGTPWKELQSERCGWWIEIGTEPLVNALRDYLRKTDDEMREMGLRGRKVIEDKYSCESIAAKLYDAYKELTNTPLTVLHYIPRIDKMSGGLGTYMQHLSEELGKKCDLHILTHYDKDNLHLVNCDINYLSSMWPTPKVRKEFNNILDKVRPDIVHVNTCWLPLSAYSVIWAKEKGYKVILTPHGMLDTLIIRHNYWTRKMPAILYYQRKAVRSADVIHTTSKREQRILHSIGWNENIEIIPNGVNTKDISLNTDRHKKRFILYLGRIHPQKGIRHLIEASAMIKDELNRNGYHIVIAGMGDENYISKLKDLSKKMDVSELIDFEGPVFGSTKWSLFREASLFVLPSYSESFGIVVAEALMSKTPVITTQGTPWEEIDGSPALSKEDEYGRCGWWIERGTKPLAKALLNFLHTNPDVLRRYGENGVKLISEKYDCDKIVNQFMSLYKKTIIW